MRPLVVIICFLFAFLSSSFAETEGEKRLREFDEFTKNRQIEHDLTKRAALLSGLKKHFNSLKLEGRKLTQFTLSAWTANTLRIDGQWEGATEKAVLEYLEDRQYYDLSAYEVYLWIRKDAELVHTLYNIPESFIPNCYFPCRKPKPPGWRPKPPSLSFKARVTKQIYEEAIEANKKSDELLFGRGGKIYRDTGNGVFSSVSPGKGKGTQYLRIGDHLTIGTDGTAYQTIGNTTYSSTGERCTTIGVIVTCK